MTGGGPPIPHGFISASWRTGLLIHTQHHRVLRRRQIQPDHIGDLGDQLRVGGELEGLTSPRRIPYSRHARATVASPIPRCAASNRLDQCVIPSFFGGGVSVAATILRWSIVRGRPERASSASPPIPLRAYRARQLVTVGRDTPTRAAISTLVNPSAASSTIRARCANPAWIVEARTQASSRSRSPFRKPKGATRTPQCLARHGKETYDAPH